MPTYSGNGFPCKGTEACICYRCMRIDPAINKGTLTRWYERTPYVLQGAIVDAYHGRATNAQRTLVSEWVTARVMGADLSMIEMLRGIAHEPQADPRGLPTQ